MACSTDLIACGVDAGRRLYGGKAYTKRGNLILNGIDVQAYAYDAEQGMEIRRKYGLGDSLLLGQSEYGLITENSAEGLYHGMKKMLTDPALRQHYAAQAAERGKAFSKRMVLCRTEDFFEELCSSKQR